MDSQVFEEVNLGSFRMSPQVNELFSALALSQHKFGVVVKDKVAKIKTKAGYEYSYTYADLGSVLDACKEHLAANGLCVLQPPCTEFIKSGGPQEREAAKVTVTTLVAHKSGQWISSEIAMVAADTSPQTIGSAITYGRRYGFSAMVGIVSEEDDDGKAASEKRAKQNDIGGSRAAQADVLKDKLKAAGLPEQAIEKETEKFGNLYSRSPVDQMLARMKDKYSALAEFKRMKAELIELLGDEEGEMRYYDFLSLSSELLGYQVKKSDQFKNVGDSKKIARPMQEALMKIQSAGRLVVVSPADMRE